MKFTLYLVISLVICVFALPVSAATYTVTNLNDSGPGSLRYGLEYQFAEINFAVTGTIFTNSPISINGIVSIVGPGADLLIIDANRTHPVMAAIHRATISGITIRNGSSSFGGGGGIDTRADLTINNCKILGNTTSGSGGAINTTFALTINNSIIRDNASAVDGGAIFGSGVSLSISNSTISDNSATNRGGGIYYRSLYSAPSFTLTNSTLSGNSAGSGGGHLQLN